MITPKKNRLCKRIKNISVNIQEKLRKEKVDIRHVFNGIYDLNENEDCGLLLLNGLIINY